MHDCVVDPVSVLWKALTDSEVNKNEIDPYFGTPLKAGGIKMVIMMVPGTKSRLLIKVDKLIWTSLLAED